MQPKTYFRISLAVPVLLTLLAMLFSSASTVTEILWFSLAFGGVAYFFFGIALFWKFGKLQSVQRMRNLTYWAPIIFVPVQSVSWLIYFYFEKMSKPPLVGGWEAIPMFAVYILIIGYTYVALVNIGYIILQRFGVFNESLVAP